MSLISDDSFPEWDLLGASKLVELQRIRPDWPVCLLGHEASKRPSCHARSRLPVIWVKLFMNAPLLLETLAGEENTSRSFFPWPRAALVFRQHASVSASRAQQRRCGRKYTPKLAGATPGDAQRGPAMAAHQLITSEMLQTLTARGEVAPRVLVCVCVSAFVCTCEDEKQSAVGRVMHNGGRNP